MPLGLALLPLQWQMRSLTFGAAAQTRGCIICLAFFAGALVALNTLKNDNTMNELVGPQDVETAVSTVVHSECRCSYAHCSTHS